jgi:hypothetical protein
MTTEELVNAIEGIKVGEEVNFDSSSFSFALTCVEVQDHISLIFGGYGTHQTIYQTDVWDTDEIAEHIEKHMSEYNSAIEGKEWITLDEVTIR